MSNSRENRWPTIVFLSSCSIFFFGCVWYLWAGALNPDYYWSQSHAMTVDATDAVLEKHGRILLAKNQGVRVDGARIVYRGSYGGNLHLDFFVLQLDPHYGYPHHIDEGQARKGFFMGEHQFQVLAASDGKISLKRL